MLIGKDCRFRQQWRGDRAAANLRAGEAARAQGRIVGKRDTRDTFACLRVDRGRKLPDLAGERLARSDRGHGGGLADRQLRQIILRKTRLHFKLPILGNPEKDTASRTDDLARLHAACENEASRRSDHIEPCTAGAKLFKCSRGNPDLSHGSVPRRGEAIDIRL